MASCGNVVLKMGSRGACVSYLNDLLIRRGSLSERDVSDKSYFGPTTSVAVREFQASSGLTVDAVVGQKTWAALGEAVNEATGANLSLDTVQPAVPSSFRPDGQGGGSIVAATASSPVGLVDRLKAGFVALEPWKKWAIIGGGLVAGLFAVYAATAKKSVSLAGFMDYLNDEPEAATKRCGRTPSEGTLESAEDVFPEA